MPSGDDAFARKLAQKEAQKAAQESARAAFTFTNDFFLRAGQTVVVRFLEEGPALTFADTHRLGIQGKNGKTWFKPFVCLDKDDDGTPCPACQHPNKEIAKRATLGFVNVIQRDAPVFQRDPETKRAVKDGAGNLVVVGHEDQIALWKCSWTVFSLLKAKDAKWKGLMARDWEITRIGSTKNDTQYLIEPADPTVSSQPMTIADLSLAEKKYDLVQITKPVEYAALHQIINRGALPDGPQQTFDRTQYAPQHDIPTGANSFEDGASPTVRASAFSRG